MKGDPPSSTDERRNGPSRALPFSGRTAWARSLRTPLRAFLRTETGGAAVLLGAALAALAWVNVHASSYEELWETTLSIDLGGSGVSLSLREWVNSGLMAFFFFVVGLEARRELDLGELRERRRFVLPLLGARLGDRARDGHRLRARRPRARRSPRLGPAACLHADRRRRGRHPRDRGHRDRLHGPGERAGPAGRARSLRRSRRRIPVAR